MAEPYLGTRSKAELPNVGAAWHLESSILQGLPLNFALDRYLNNEGATAAEKPLQTKFLALRRVTSPVTNVKRI
jgi:hypothetical protein